MSLSNPKVTININTAAVVRENSAQRILLVGQKTSVGTAPSGVLVSNIQNDGSENALFGANSMLADMVRAFKRVNQICRLDAIPLADNGSGVAATASFAISGTATTLGTLIFSAGSSINYSYSIPVAAGDTATVIGAALAAAITADTRVPVTAASVTGTVTLTAVNKGTIANFIGIQYTGTVAGITIVLTGMSGGATNPSLTGLFTPVADVRYQTVVYPSEYTLATLTTNFLDPRFNVDNNVLDGVGVITAIDTFSNLITLGNSSNSQSLAIIGNKKIATSTYIGGAIFELDYVQSTYFAAIRSLRLTQDANISQYVIGGESRDQFGGAALASLPYFNTPVTFLPLIGQGNNFTQVEIDELLDGGVSVFGNNLANNQIIMGQIVTAYKTDSGGNPDPSYKFLNYVDTSVTAREFIFNNLKVDAGNSRLTEGALIPNRKMHNAGSLAALLGGYYRTLSGQDYVLFQAGNTAIQFFKNSITIVLDISAGKATITMSPLLVTQLREIVGTMTIAFSTTN